MKQYCKDFPTIMPTTVKYDPIMEAAESSYRFVRIHPYHDGNGRISRLLMNLVLWGTIRQFISKRMQKADTATVKHCIGGTEDICSRWAA